MTSPGPLEVADIVRQHADDWRERYGGSPQQRRVLRDLARCRTSALGGHIEQCDRCEHRRIAYNSCRNRHCPKCQGSTAARWLQARQQELLPVPYFHVVFTIPASLAEIALQNKRVVYGFLFQAAAQTLLEVAADPQHLGARLGFLAVLHTWGQNLMHHPHVHCVVPAGGLSHDGDRWIAGDEKFFLPVRVLSRVFRGKFLDLLKRAFFRGKLQFHGHLAQLADPGAWEHWLNRSVQTEWVVYSKPPFGSPQAVLKYLARYTHRVAISNRRLLSLSAGRVTFRYKDSADQRRPKTLTLDAVEFLRRFLLHVLPRGFMRIRHFGFGGNRCRSATLKQCRRLLDDRQVERPANEQPSVSSHEPIVEREPSSLCPVCRQGRLQALRLIPSACPDRRRLRPPRVPVIRHDTS